MIRSIQLPPYTFFADDSGRPGLEVLQNGLNYEPHVADELRKWLPTSNGFADLGCNVGIHTIHAKILRPDLSVICADASPPNIAILLRTIEHNQLKNITVLPFPLAERTCILRTNLHSPNTCVSHTGCPDSEDYPGLAAAFALDSLVLPSVDLIKIDVEGFEIRVLQGATKLLAPRPRIIFEFCPEITHRSGLTPAETLAFFYDKGYRLTVLDYIPGTRKMCATPAEVLAHVAATSKWITDIIAEPA